MAVWHDVKNLHLLLTKVLMYHQLPLNVQQHNNQGQLQVSYLAVQYFIMAIHCLFMAWLQLDMI